MAIKKLKDNATLEDLQTWALEVQEEYTNLENTLKNTTKEVDTLKEEKTKLQEHNQKLFLKLTSNEESTKEKEDEEPHFEESDIINIFN